MNHTQSRAVLRIIQVSGVITEFIGSQPILSARATLTLDPLYPLSIVTDVQVCGRTGVIHPSLLNPGESVYVRYAVAGFQPKVSVSGRMVGVSAIGNIEARDFIWGRLSILGGMYASYLIGALRGDAIPKRAALVLSIPFIGISVAQFVGLGRRQCMWFSSFDVADSHRIESRTVEGPATAASKAAPSVPPDIIKPSPVAPQPKQRKGRKQKRK